MRLYLFLKKYKNKIASYPKYKGTNTLGFLASTIRLDKDVFIIFEFRLKFEKIISRMGIKLILIISNLIIAN